ncbi:MAG: LLM class flavin-dependent oxidoreductase [Chloroflexi bacterium]|nr:LLM class flavin-dependent oxidoreductase [Chloroflexota bacterium]
MEVGFFTMPLHPPGSDYTQTLDDDLEQLVVLDELGYKEAWIGEHFTSVWENIPAPDLFIAKALAMTKNIVLGTGVTCMPNHNPFMIAHRIAQLDHLAHGRFNWGVGSGGFIGDFKVFGFDPETGEHRSMARDAVDVVLKMWDDPKPGVYEHKWWRFTIPEPMDEIGLGFHLKPYQKPHPPIGVAGVSPKSETLRLAGERGWIPMSINLVPSNQLATHWEAVQEGAQRTGRVADRSIWRIAREVYTADTSEQARKDALEGVLSRDFERYFKPLLSEMKVLSLMKEDPDMPDSDVTPEYLVDNIWVVGSPDDVTEKLRRLYDEVGGFGVLLAMGHEWRPRDKWVNSMTVLAKEVMPRMAELS